MDYSFYVRIPLLACAYAATVIIGTGGLRGQVHFFPQSPGYVRVALDTLQPTINGLDFEVHEFLVDYSLAPNVRCRTEYVGPRVQFRQRQGNWIATTIGDLILHSLVLRVHGEPISCGTIVPFSLPDLSAIVNFRSNVFGRLYVVQWSGE